MSDKIYIYSGKCRLCEIGLETHLLDYKENKLYTGDIVLIHNENGYSYPDHLTVIIENNWKNISGKESEFLGRQEAFAMGIKNAKICKGEWQIIKVKSFFDVIDGEHWKEYGFSYKSFKDKN